MNGIDATTKSFQDMRLVSVIRTPDNRPRLELCGEWLYKAGFVPHAAVKLLPEPGGFAFALCAEPPPNAKKRRWDGDGLAEVRLYRNAPALAVSGKILERSSLAFGDTVIVLYEHGYIHLRKVSGGAVKVVSSHFCGKWLDTQGFSIGACFTLDAQPGLITCKLQENAVARTLELVKFARQNKLKILQVENIKRVPHVFVPTSCLNKAGFAQDDALLATYDYGHITLRKLDFCAVGF